MTFLLILFFLPEISLTSLDFSSDITLRIHTFHLNKCLSSEVGISSHLTGVWKYYYYDGYIKIEIASLYACIPTWCKLLCRSDDVIDLNKSVLPRTFQK